MFFGLFYFLVLFGSIIFLAYISTRFIGVRTSKGLKGKHIKIIDSIVLGIDRQIFLIKVGDQLLLVSSSNKTIQFLTLIDNNKIDIDENSIQGLDQEQQLGLNAFKNYFDLFKGVIKKKETNNVKETVSSNNYDNNQVNQNNKFNQNLDKLKGIFSKINSDQTGDEKLHE